MHVSTRSLVVGLLRVPLVADEMGIVGDLDAVFENGDTVDPAALKRAGLAKGPADGIRILGTGEVTKKLTVKAHHFSKSAAENTSISPAPLWRK